MAAVPEGMSVDDFCALAVAKAAGLGQPGAQNFRLLVWSLLLLSCFKLWDMCSKNYFTYLNYFRIAEFNLWLHTILDYVCGSIEANGFNLVSWSQSENTGHHTVFEGINIYVCFRPPYAPAVAIFFCEVASEIHMRKNDPQLILGEPSDSKQKTPQPTQTLSPPSRGDVIIRPRSDFFWVESVDRPKENCLVCAFEKQLAWRHRYRVAIAHIIFLNAFESRS